MTNLPIGILVSTHHPTRKNAHRPMMMSTSPLIFGSKLYIDSRQRVFLENQQVFALYDRFPFQKMKEQYPLNIDVPIPVANPKNIALLCKDKWNLQQYLTQKGIAMPHITRTSFASFLNQNDSCAIAKPRFGSYGVGVAVVDKPPPSTLPSVCGEDETLLQQWIKPPKDWAGISIRQLIQRDTDYSWIPRTTVVRCSKTDPVVNVTRGAKAIPAKELLLSKTIQNIHKQSVKAAQYLAELPNGEWIVELGIDFVIDAHWNPWLIEINTQPKGKLKSLYKSHPEIYEEEFMNIIEQPFQCLKTWCQ
ncbi:MAG: hypothetical protein CL916_11090 [Deltaproteobacteria bacterium]|nr:hypothetical protein [Deltaproteobacteria bacterium]